MKKNKIVEDSENQHLMRLDSEKKEEVKKVQNEKTTEIESTFTRHV